MSVRRRRRLSVVVPIATIGDIAFLLIIFFVLVSNFREQNIELEQPDAPDIEQLEAAGMTVSIDETGQVWFGGARCAAEALETRVGDRLEGRADKTVMLQVDRELAQHQYGPVVLALSRAGATIAMVGTLSDEP
ncbi:MAG: ExbD/TolR family protein [Planctomycetota bacterium]